MSELLEFLKYGAIGIALALAVLSYKLLAREQDKTEVRPPVLNTIKFYFIFSIFLSLLFAGVELYSAVGVKSGNNQELDELHKTFLGNRPDSTDHQKTAALTNLVNELQQSNEKLTAQLESINKEDESLDFYKNVSDLSAFVNQYGGINLAFQPNAKQEVFNTLNKLFIRLELCDNYIETNEAVINQWKSLKAKWSNESLQWIHNSDMGTLVRHYLNIQNKTRKQRKTVTEEKKELKPKNE